jgi:phosphoinositide-3-kinase regulatory subunit 4
MGNQTSLDQNFINSQNYTNARQLGSSRFLRTFHCAYVNSGGIIIKQFSKPPFILMDNYLLQLNIQKEKLSGRENCCLIPYIIAEAPQNIFLQRQYFMHNLYDRISTRPFYVNIERVWIAYQLLKALAYSDSLSICHGDVKCENIMISSCNWLYLCDFASYKPTYLPQDDPTDYSFFFDSSNRRACYLAPERFTASASSSNELNNHKMDVFSAGCVIAELFLDGTPLFSYSQILQYKSCQYSPTAEIERIENPEVKEMVYSMISLDPNNRKNATDYLEMFPPFFSKFYSIFSSPSFFFSNQDERITFLNRHVNDLLAKSNVHPIFTPVMDILGDPLNDPSSWLVPSIEFNHVSASPAILLLPVFCSFRNVSSPSIRIIAIENLVNISRYVEDSIILDRIVPALMDAVENDPVDWVKANSLLSLTLVLSMVSFLPSSDATIYEDYIFPGLNLKSFNSSILLKCTFARCFPSLCFSALKGLENRVWEDSSFEMALNDLHSFLFPLLLELLTDQNPIVKRIILYNITDLCVFFDRSRAGDILGHCITFLNDKDWALRR